MKNEVAHNLIKRTLPVQLSEADITAMGRRSAQAARRQTALELRLKNIAARFKERVADAKKEIGHCTECIMSGQEPREVLCEVVRLPAQKKVEVRRCDTGQVVESRAMTDSESQMAIDDYLGRFDVEREDVRDEIADEAALEADSPARVPA